MFVAVAAEAVVVATSDKVPPTVVSSSMAPDL